MGTETALFHWPGRDGRVDVCDARSSVRWWVPATGLDSAIAFPLLPTPGPQSPIVSKGSAAQKPGILCVCGWCEQQRTV